MLAGNAMPETDCFDAGAALTKTQDWKTYRTRFLVRARQLNEPAVVIDASGRELVTLDRRGWLPLLRRKHAECCGNKCH